jgi:signal transduction histidine kinase
VDAAATITAQVNALRRLAVTLYPPDLSARGLPAAIEELAGPLRNQGVQVVIEARPLPDLDPAVIAALYRVARECLANVAQHASASAVRICVALDPDGTGVSLSVADDGVGLAEPAAADDDRRHLGLRLLADGIADIGGELRVRSHRPGGTTVEARTPVSPGRRPLDLRRS